MCREENDGIKSGTRVIPMTEDVYEAFRDLLMKRKTPDVEPEVDGVKGFLYLDKNEHPVLALHWEHYFQRIRKKFNEIYKEPLPYVSPHVCRHTYCSNQARSGMNPKTLQYLMGHSDIGVTLNTYTHLGLEDAAVEAVMIPDEDRRTLCVSSQSGCRMGCRFCMTGRQGFHGQLSAADILSQFIAVDESHELTNAVFMGMGEPLDNYENVMRAIEILTADWGFAWSPKRITLSSVGVMPNLRRYLDESRCHLAISMHNPFPEERADFMPVQKAWDIEEVVRLIRGYDFSGQRRVSFEYIMFSGVNDSKRHADAVIRLLRGLECRVNLIRFHKIPDFPYVSSPDPVMEQFRDRLNAHGITCTIRSSRGEDILAACGMLAGKHNNGQTL